MPPESNHLKVIFAGTPVFALSSLEALFNSPCHIVGVLTREDSPKGRGRKIQPSPVKQFAKQNNLPLLQPLTLKETATLSWCQSRNPDIMVVASYSMLIPEAILALPRLGAINVHPSLLPKWRGAAPIQHSIWAGDTQTGVTIMQMNQGLDTGDILNQAVYPISPNDTYGSLHNALATTGAQLLLKTLTSLQQGQVTPIPQNNHQATPAPKITKAQAQLDWRQNATLLERQIRAFNPKPICYTFLNGVRLRVWQSQVLKTKNPNPSPGTIVDVSPLGIDVSTGEDVLRLQTIQLPGGEALPVLDIRNGNKLPCVPGMRFSLTD